MLPRLKKLKVLLSLREREVLAELGSLRLAQQDEQSALLVEQQAREQVRLAIDARRVLGTKPGGADDFMQADAWADASAGRHGQTRVALRRAQVEVSRVARRVDAARMRQKQVENLMARLQAEGVAEARRAERRDEDEIAALLARRS